MRKRATETVQKNKATKEYRWYRERNTQKRQSYKSETELLELTIQEKEMNKQNNSSDGKESWNWEMKNCVNINNPMPRCFKNNSSSNSNNNWWTLPYWSVHTTQNILSLFWIGLCVQWTDTALYNIFSVVCCTEILSLGLGSKYQFVLRSTWFASFFRGKLTHFSHIPAK